MKGPPLISYTLEEAPRHEKVRQINILERLLFSKAYSSFRMNMRNDEASNYQKTKNELKLNSKIFLNMKFKNHTLHIITCPKMHVIWKLKFF